MTATLKIYCEETPGKQWYNMVVVKYNYFHRAHAGLKIMFVLFSVFNHQDKGLSQLYKNLLVISGPRLNSTARAHFTGLTAYYAHLQADPECKKTFPVGLGLKPTICAEGSDCTVNCSFHTCAGLFLKANDPVHSSTNCNSRWSLKLKVATSLCSGRLAFNQTPTQKQKKKDLTAFIMLNDRLEPLGPPLSLTCTGLCHISLSAKRNGV